MKTIFITGATSGIGASIAKLFANEGYRVIAAGRRKDNLDALQKEFGSKIFPLELDVRDRESVEMALQQLPKEFAEIDILVNNAGLALGLKPAHQADLDDWEVMVDTNIKGLMTVTRLVLPGMVERNRGHIVNIGSVAGSFAYPGGNVYGGTKAFVKQFSWNLNADLLGTNVKVTNIEPGLLGETEFSKVRFKGDEASASKVYAGTQPLLPDDVADAVYWAVTRPAHVNIQEISILPVCQAPAGFTIKRNEK